MKMKKDAIALREQEVALKRRDLEVQVESLRGNLEREFNWMPKKAVWLVPIAGAALGIALALRRFRSRRSQ
jgi:uncharacterized membrane protein